METQVTTRRPETFSIASIVAVISAILSFATGAVLGFVFAGLAIVAGLFGVVVALSPAKRGGFASVLAILGGLVGIVAAVVKLLMWIF
ncbi:hypothetical protein [Roseibacillus ishigakijimensis]|uniref:Uncharacterized protein n=1 Tax=Roseibacillus ishigakijimensis TaxID=454146 RepID=A0A934VLQ5_9BACT|nr:hypothetical protein [Roseibacillus ishigakijimensis]MBK1833135.1 hypothetical protein [Roseibacillus ishigakijimensis]